MDFIKNIKEITRKKPFSKERIYDIVKSVMKERSILKEMSSYNRVRSHIEGGNSFVIVSSDRHERSGAENRRMYQQMKQDFASAGFSFTRLEGGFRETTETETDLEAGENLKPEFEESVYVIENSLMATTHGRGEGVEESTPDALFDFAVEMSRKYNQEAFIFGETATTARGKETKIINAYNKDGEQVQDSWAGPWSSVETVSRDSDFWSRVKGKHFQLKERKKTSQPRSWIEALMKSRQGLKW